MKRQRKQNLERQRPHAVRRTIFVPMPPRRPLAGPLEECELIELENWIVIATDPEAQSPSWWQHPSIPDCEAARRIRLLIEYARK